MDIKDIVNLFKKHKFKVVDVSFKNDIMFTIETENLIIGIFGYDYPNTGYCGKILAEHKDNFDKWSKAFYSASFPSDAEELEIILDDLKYISNEKNKKSGNNFGRLVRSF